MSMLDVIAFSSTLNRWVFWKVFY